MNIIFTMIYFSLLLTFTAYGSFSLVEVFTDKLISWYSLIHSNPLSWLYGDVPLYISKFNLFLLNIWRTLFLIKRFYLSLFYLLLILMDGSIFSFGLTALWPAITKLVVVIFHFFQGSHVLSLEVCISCLASTSTYQCEFLKNSGWFFMMFSAICYWNRFLLHSIFVLLFFFLSFSFGP